jgi:prolyl 4-hydroxylase
MKKRFGLIVIGILAALQLLPVEAGNLPPGFKKGPRPGSWIETMSWKPRAFVWHGFLSNDEADHVRNLAAPRMERSSVVNYDGSVTPADDIRTSYGTFLEPAEDEVIRDIDIRVGHWTHLPPSHTEAMQVLRYEYNQTYGGHWDELDPTIDAQTISGASPRVATVLIYLTDTEEGGETAFPHSEWIDREAQTAGRTYNLDCTMGGVAVHPIKGDALMFYGLKVNVSRLEPFSLHTGCPVKKGTKWTAVKWLHLRSYSDRSLYGETSLDDDEELVMQYGDDGEDFSTDSQQNIVQGREERGNPLEHPCVDKDKRCENWASAGECRKNFKFMLGTKTYQGACLKSCKFCCPPGDVLCERKLEGERRQLENLSK